MKEQLLGGEVGFEVDIVEAKGGLWEFGRGSSGGGGGGGLVIVRKGGEDV